MRRKIIFSVIIFFLSWLFVEIACYITLKGISKATRMQSAFKNSGLYDSKQSIDTLYTEQETIWRNIDFDFYRFYRAKANFKGQYITTDSQGFRKTAQYFKKVNRKKKVIVFLGGSTMWGIGSAGDHATIPSLFAKYINGMDADVNYEVRNYGVGGYNNTQEMILLMEKLGNEQIDFVIFYDWVNETIMGYREFLDGKNQPSFLQPSVGIGIPGMISFLTDRGVYSWATNFKKALMKSNIAKIVLRIRNTIVNSNRAEKENVGSSSELTASELDQVERIINCYKKNKKIIQALSDIYNFKTYFIMQPNLFTKDKEKLSAFEKACWHWDNRKLVKFHQRLYQLARKEFSADADFFDISDCLNVEGTIYLDDHHTNIKGNRFIVEALIGKIGPEIIGKGKKEGME